MRRPGLTISAAGVLALAASGTVGGAPPLFNATDHPVDASLTPEIGVNCGTGMPTLITGSYSGVVHTLVQADGTVHVNGSVRGSAVNDDVLPDGIPDATTTFQSTFRDTFRSNGRESHQFTLNGAGTTTATGARFRFHVLIQTMLDENGDPKVDIFRFTCF
jgi:hypothetical protein